MNYPQYLRNELFVKDIGKSLSIQDPIFPNRADIKKIGPINTLREFKQTGLQSLKVLLNYTHLSPDSSVLDIGCGYGRLAIPLTRYLGDEGSYVGFDVMAEAVADCRERIGDADNRFQFDHFDVHNGMYNKQCDTQIVASRFPYPDNQFDVAYAFSVFSHMMPEDVAVYLKEIHRILKPGGMLMATFFILNVFSEAAIASGATRRTFSNESNGVRVDDAKRDETAVAYPQSHVEELVAQSSLQHVHTFLGQWAGHRWSLSGQDAVICRRPEG